MNAAILRKVNIECSDKEDQPISVLFKPFANQEKLEKFIKEITSKTSLRNN